MSRSGEHGTTQTVPGPASAANRREEAAREGERERRPDPDPDDSELEVIAVSPRTLTAESPFACEDCGKGFLRDQSLQLHRRGHGEPRLARRDSRGRRAYVCPVASCARHDPSRAPGDLAGIRSHYRRRHGGAGSRRKWKCDLCGERYGADHDWEAHAMVCGARKYGCGGCGTVFSRQDSFVTHRAFCDGRAQRRENVATVASALHRLALPSQAGGHGGASGLGLDMRIHPRSVRGMMVVPAPAHVSRAHRRQANVAGSFYFFVAKNADNGW
ncbi:unnamed protein product [Urochloa humidicola]